MEWLNENPTCVGKPAQNRTRRIMLACRRIPLQATVTMANPLLLPFLNWARKLRYPTLFKITAVLFVISLLLPPGIDPIPFLDEILFGLGTLLLANWKSRKQPPPLDQQADKR
jgi:hypothetical protein